MASVPNDHNEKDNDRAGLFFGGLCRFPHIDNNELTPYLLIGAQLIELHINAALQELGPVLIMNRCFTRRQTLVRIW